MVFKRVFPTALSFVFFGCGESMTNNGGANAAEPQETIADVCCFPGESGELLHEQCEDSFIAERVCEEESRCCEESWYPECAAGYALNAASCTNGATTGSGSGESSGGGGAYEPGTTVIDGHPPMQATLIVQTDPEIRLETGQNLFIAGFSEVEDHTGRPGREASPDHYAQITANVSAFPHRETLTLYTDLHYWVMYGTGEHPGPGDNMSQIVRTTSGTAEFTFVLGAETIPAEGENTEPTDGDG